MRQSSKVKIWLTCPKNMSETLRLAIGDAGIGQIGNYSHCSFVTEGKGYFKPSDKANPYIGKADTIEEVDEVIIEFVCEIDKLTLLKEIIDKHHPYEEAAIDVFPLLEI